MIDSGSTRLTSHAENILGVLVTTRTLDECLDEISRWVETRVQAKYFACANPHSIQIAARDERFLAALRDADLVVPDGVGVVLASRVLRGRIRRRITGADIFFGVNTRLNRIGNRSCVFVGTTETTLALIARRMAVDFPAVIVKGLFPLPYRSQFGWGEDGGITETVVRAINRTKADVVWVGMTAPKQEKWVAAIRDHLEVRCVGPVGALFDFYVGRIRRCPPLLGDAGLEWMCRWAQEPRRLWRRNAVSNPVFLARVLTRRLSESIPAWSGVSRRIE